MKPLDHNTRRNDGVFTEFFPVTPSQPSREVQRQGRKEYDISPFWLVVIFVGLAGFLSITAPPWETMDWGACETEGC